ncbi:FecR family protein [Croceitalea marina]|uniref:FecR family protein n=1 Tax=Croceitalea marina TaxID=1775166 RepID=A0ABW5MZS2_9FLAO
MTKYSLLINKFLEKKISTQERDELRSWVSESDEHMNLFKNSVKDFYEDKIQDYDSDLAFKKFMTTVRSQEKSKRGYIRFLRYAAILIVLLSIGILTKNRFDQSESNTGIELVETENTAPTGNNIVIKLSDGSIKTITADGNELIKDADGNVIADKESNSLSFEDNNDSKTDLEERYNEVYIPFGQKFELKLSDGTKVWLNSGSKLRFPQKFSPSKKHRMVYLEGEAFFDVSSNKELPFIVNTQEIDIKVLGTEFNVSSYKDDKYISTTLVEGSVSVYEARTPDNAILLTPSYQANYDKFGNKLSKKIVDTNDYTAWMHNRLVINNLTFSQILVKLERRHHVKIINNVERLNDATYKGEFENEDIESILKTISLSTPFNFEKDQSTIIITK